ncbi:imelysin family protein [uncultured Cohaesibacter sp.]|uniref:imelysin family protein n=1 Tax=uncultured Cohaesibacter sp. TaxID=1002546 RepID=UPI00292DD3C8|nr:imelysin family protein [uncultured Cohaesibacter sp.]
MFKYCLLLFALMTAPLAADETGSSLPDMEKIVKSHILPGLEDLARTAEDLAQSVAQTCPDNPDAVKEAYGKAFDAWVRVSHLRFGPSETDDRAYALAFWPDTKGFTPKTLQRLLQDRDPAIESVDGFKAVSIAARGFYPLEFLLYDPQFVEHPSPNRCQLMRVMTQDIAANALAIRDDWKDGYGSRLISADNETYRSHEEAIRQVYTALTTALLFTSDTRLGRPMGSFTKPRPARAEARRSGRSLRHVILSLEANRELASLLSQGDEDIDQGFERAIRIANELDDPDLSGVATIQGRIRAEALQGAISFVNDLLAEYLAPRLGITAGFNALDGD